MNDDIPLEEPPVDDGEPGMGANGLPEQPQSGPAGRSTGRNQAAGPAQPTKTANGLPPVGDIELKKKSGTYNTYTIKLSYGQIECIRQALEKDHATPIADELKALFDYYLQTLPGPGEEEEDVKARDEMVSGGEGGEGGGDDDSPLPMPPGEEDDGEVTVAGEGPQDDFEDPMGGGGEDDGGGLPEPPAPQAMPDFGDDEFSADDRLPSPPRE